MSACQKAITYAKNLGVDEFEVIFVKKKVLTVRITDSQIAEIKENFENSFGIRLIHKKRIVSAQTNTIDEFNFEKLFKSISYVKPREFWGTLPQRIEPVRKIEKTFDEKLARIDSKDACDIAQTMINSAENYKVSSISGSLNIVTDEIELQNSYGNSFTDKNTYISGIVNSDSEFGVVPVSGLGHDCCRTLAGFSPEQIGLDATEMCTSSINPKSCQSETCSVIFEPYSVGEILAFVFASNFSQRIFEEKKSCFANDFGKKIAVDEFTLIDDPHAPDAIGSKSVDDEGIPTKKNLLINKGVFQNTFSNLYDAFKTGKDSTGNANRPGSPMGTFAEPIPISSPHNLRIVPGTASQDEMIKNTKHGILVGRLWYTYAVNPTKGDFSCTARSGIKIIENGKIISAGKPVRIIHNLITLLQNISQIGSNERNVIQWASLPSITPSISVDKIKISPI